MSKQKERPAKKIGIWIRVSTEEQAEGDSPKHHEARARMYAEIKNWKVATVYDLAGVSGKSVLEHAETKRMLSDVVSGRIDALIFSKLARLARNTRELLDVAEHFKAHGADLVSLEESIDTTSPAGRFFYTLLAAMSQWEREEISARVKSSVLIRAKLGKPLGGQAPFGYQWVDGELHIDPEEGPIRRLMYDLFLDSKRIKTVIRTLTDAGHRTRRGGKFAAKTVKRLLQDPTAKGKRRANYTQRSDTDTGWTKKSEDEWIWTDVPALVSKEVWSAVNAILDERKREFAKRPAKKRTQLFGGVVYCGCGQKMYVPSKSVKYTCTECKHKIPADDLERIFVEELKNFVFDPEQVSAHLTEADRVLAEKDQLIESMGRERAQIALEMDRVYRLYVEDEISPKSFGERYRPLEERRDQLDISHPRLQGERDYLAVKKLSSAEIFSEAQTLYDGWYDLSIEDRRQIVEVFVERVEVANDLITFDLSHSPPTTPPNPENTHPSSPTPISQTVAKGWRRGWDSNPRTA